MIQADSHPINLLIVGVFTIWWFGKLELTRRAEQPELRFTGYRLVLSCSCAKSKLPERVVAPSEEFVRGFSPTVMT